MQILDLPYFDNTLKDYSARMTENNILQDSKNILFENMIYCSAMFKRKDWEKLGGYDETMIYGLEDWEFWLRLLELEIDVVFIPKVHFFYRIKQMSMVKRLSILRTLSIYKYIVRRHPYHYGRINILFWYTGFILYHLKNRILKFFKTIL